MKRALVLGANGFIGSAVTRELLAAGHAVTAADCVRDFYALAPHPRLVCQTLDFLDEVAVRHTLAGIDWVFHLVGTTKPASSNANMAFDVQSNVVGSIHLLEAAVAQGVERVLFASSGGTVYGPPRALPVREDHPTHPIVSYGLTKLMIEGYADLIERQHGLPTIALRIGNPYGPRHYDREQGAIPVFIRQLRRDQTIEIWGDGEIVRDYVHVDDVARAFVAAAGYLGPHRVFNIGSGTGHSLREIVARLEALAGRQARLVFRPARGFDIPAIVLDIERARAALDWAPAIDFDDGLSLTWEDMK
ncbi:NAD-dependent epimerase/dehydratase family protein [Thioalkalicoccus limnaeus]|uniref:NAD-dependent epimerase/dehydratase family protein n=1 Tax=Thioalkalicoccus limnaeus TaxID=120681 RepID=A0ABV4BC88_9GAMM